MEKFGQLIFIFLAFTSLVPGAFASIFDGELNTPTSIHSLLTPEKNIVVEIGVEYVHPDLPTIHNVVVENQSTSTAVSGPVNGDVQGGYPDTLAQTLKIQAMLDSATRWTIALKTYLPLNGIDQIDTGNEYQPEFVLYRSEAQRPRVLLTSAIDLSPHWRLGLGLDVSFSVSAQADVFLQSGAGTVSDQRISAKVKPGFVPQASLAYDQFSFTVRGENKADFDLTTNAGARVFNDLNAGLDFSYSSQSVLYYQPWDFELLGQIDLTPSIAIRPGISYQLWSGFKSRAAVIQTTGSGSCPSGSPADCTSQFSSGATPEFTARNLFIPELGFKFKTDHFNLDTLEFDYQYKDSIFAGLPTGIGNYLDPPRHDFLFGFTHITKAGWQWNIHTSLSRLTSQTVVKSDPSSIGGPGYTADGWLYGGGLSVAIPFKD
jgi:hypothetical protein